MDLPFCFEPQQKSCTLLKLSDTQTCVVVCNSCEAIPFWQILSTAPSRYHVTTCADVSPLCFVVQFYKFLLEHYHYMQFDISVSLNH